MRVPCLCLCLLAAACKPGPAREPSGSGTEGGASSDPRRLDKQFYVPAGKFAEVNVQMSAGEEATADYVVDGGTIEWNVHSHPKGDDQVVHDEGDGPKGGMTFHAPADGAYSFLFENKKGKKNLMIRVRLTLSGTGRVTSTVP